MFSNYLQEEFFFTPRGILCFDMDDTLLDIKASKEKKEIVLINPEKIKEILKKAYKNGLLSMIVTARDSKLEKVARVSYPYLSIYHVTKELGENYFNRIIFTENISKKAQILATLQSSFKILYNQIVLIDDNDIELAYCQKKNFSTIKVDKNTTDYLAKIEEYIENSSKLSFYSISMFHSLSILPHDPKNVAIHDNEENSDDEEEEIPLFTTKFIQCS
jgi:HAD superfamily phosphatase (TIGR01681 family)